MSLVRPGVYDNGQMRVTAKGDLVANSEAVLSNATVGALAMTGAMLASGILSRSGSVAGYADTFPSAADLVTALNNQYYVGSGASPSGVGLSTNLSFRLRILNTVAFANTVVAGTGVTLIGTTAIPASSWKDYLITILNGTPPQTFAADTTNASAVLTNLNAAAIAGVTVGAIVTGTGIPAATTVIGVGPTSVTLSANATATNAQTSLTFSPAYSVTGIGGGLN